MNKEKVIEILKTHNKWRRGNENIEMLNPKEIGQAIDFAIKYLESTKKCECNDNSKSSNTV